MGDFSFPAATARLADRPLCIQGLSHLEGQFRFGERFLEEVHALVQHPVVGDPVYDAHAPRDPEAQLGLERQFLHSFRRCSDLNHIHSQQFGACNLLCKSLS